MASKSGRGQKRISDDENWLNREMLDRRSVSRGNTIGRAARTQPETLVRTTGGTHTDGDYRTALPRDIIHHARIRQRLLRQAKQMEKENADFTAALAGRMSVGQTELPREVTKQIGVFAQPHHISNLTKTNMGEPSKSVTRLTRDNEGRKVIKHENPSRGESAESVENEADDVPHFHGPSIGLANWNLRAVPTKAHKGGKRKSKRRRRVSRKKKSRRHRRKKSGKRKSRRRKSRKSRRKR